MMYRSLAAYYERLFPLNQAAVSFVTRQAPAVCRRVLDVGCGTGSLIRALSHQYEQVMGMDPDPEMIREAKQLAEREELDVAFSVGGMAQVRQKEGEWQWDMVLCLGNTLPHLTDTDEQVSFLRDTRSVLRPAARLVIQTVNFDAMQLDRPRPFPTLRRDELEFHRTYVPTSQPGIIRFVTRLDIPLTAALEGETRLAVLNKDTLVRLLQESGFHVLSCFGDFSGGRWTEDAPATVVVAQKA